MSSTISAQQVPEFFSSHIRAARRFYLDAVPPADTPLAVVCGGRESCSRTYAIHRRSFPYYSLEFVAKGAGALQLNRKQHALKAGDVFTYGPDVAHDITTNPDNLLQKYFVDFTGPRALQLLSHYGLGPGAYAHASAPGEVQEVFDNLIRDGLGRTGSSGALCAALGEYLIVKVADSITPSQSQPSAAFATFQRCRTHIASHFQTLRSLEEAAEECGIDPAYLCRLFRRFDRQGPYRFLTRLKMNWAAEQLRNPTMLVRHVAAQVGFRDPYHFSHAFKNVFGLSPDAFRRLR